MSGHHDPRVLFTISGIKAYHIQNGEESSLTPSGPQTLSLLMVPTSSPFSDPSNSNTQAEVPEDDFYLHLNLPPELELSLPATTQIYHQPPNSYLIPRWDLGPESGAFTRIEFPPLGKGPNPVTQDDIDTFETILAQCTAFLEREKAPAPEKGLHGYNPSNFKPGEGYAAGTGGGMPGQVVLIDEENGSIVGELGEGAAVIEDPKLKHGTKSTAPVEIQVSEDGNHIYVQAISEEYLEMARHPAYRDSSMVQNAAAASRLIVTATSHVSNFMASTAENFTTKTKPANKALNFKPNTHARVRKINQFTGGAAGLSSKTVGQLSHITQNIGAKLASRGTKESKIGYDEKGNPYKNENYKPGLLNKSMIAFSTVADGIAYGGTRLLTSGGAAATQMVGHRYGAEAGGLTAELAGGVKNCGLVYIDVTGVSRRAVLKSVAKGMVVGRVKGGGEVVVGGGDGGQVPQEFQQQMQNEKQGVSNDRHGGYQPSVGGASAPGGAIGHGNQAPPAYSSGVGEPLGGQALQGQYPPEKGDRFQ
ncbi:hypothetical protein P152DRAFT_399769 [Eremomyces bilateralis CBS 781.70]|uniref:Senescence domain-containing protein n=1 Tax=Eremomyces bilateralis CBS 781.70 TaxID=1392243 RepID=A0A6G1G0K0_9PEZI|nr:uncharacterized protein P152DRAFT_399769 [Eremomyces bilateralis CBS 781.70]KAF1811339.1 hypothetical protein P152DRAFT_399769 [Eremomyces bilateralis CBS 781.70]